ncbi:IS481 family transposase, partial [Rhodococcus sp. NPDC058521]
HLPAQQDATIHPLTVSRNGVISIGSTSVNVGRARNGQTVTVLLDGDHVTAYEQGGAVLGHLHLDHTKRYQGQLRPAAA